MTRSVAVITDVHATCPRSKRPRRSTNSASTTSTAAVISSATGRIRTSCAWIEERAIPTIYGNYDYAIGRDLEDCGCAYVDRHDREIGQLSIEWTLAQTNERSKALMRALPFGLCFELGGKRIRLVHGSPRKVNEYLFEDKPARTFERIAALTDADVLVFGHTHKPWVCE